MDKLAENMTTTAFNATFKGYDYSELAERFGVDVTDSVEPLRARLTDLLYENDGNAIAMVRAFVVALANNARQNGYAAPVWFGLAAVADDHTFLNYLIPLIDRAWD